MPSVIPPNSRQLSTPIALHKLEKIYQPKKSDESILVNPPLMIQYFSFMTFNLDLTSLAPVFQHGFLRSKENVDLHN